MVIDTMRIRPIFKRHIDTTMMQKRGRRGTISRWVGMTNLRTLRRGRMENYHTPFWSSRRRSAPPIDCNPYPKGSQQAFLRGSG